VTVGLCLICPSKRCRKIAEDTRARDKHRKKSDLPARRSGGCTPGLWALDSLYGQKRFAIAADGSTSRDVGVAVGTAMDWVTSNWRGVISVKTAADVGIECLCAPRQPDSGI